MTLKSPVSLSKVAKKAKVSVATVSRVINNVPGVAESTRLRTQKTLEELGYEPDRKLSRFFSRLHTGSSKTIAYITTPDRVSSIQINDGFYSRFQFSLLQELRNRKYHLLLSDSNDTGPDACPRCVSEELVDAVIAHGIPDQLVSRIAERIPIILLNHEYYEDHIDSVIPNVEWAAHEQIHHLYDLGHRSIACFHIRPGGWQDRRFWNSYQNICSNLGINIPPEFMGKNELDYTMQRAYVTPIAKFLKRVLNSSNPPTAIMTHDIYAAEIIRQLAEINVKVPNDMSIIGYDDFAFGDSSAIPLTTYRQNFEAMAEAAATMLMERLKNPELPSRLMQIKGTFIVRDSCAKAP